MPMAVAQIETQAAGRSNNTWLTKLYGTMRFHFNLGDLCEHYFDG